MRLVPFPFALLTACCLLGAEKPLPRAAPIYSALSIVNAADNQSGQLAPNTIGTIYGANLAYSTAVLLDNVPAALYYVSPVQINFLVPPNLLPGPVSVYVDVDSTRGPLIQLTLGRAAPGLFQLDPQNAVATFTDGSVLTTASPAKPGDFVSLWATGLGETTPPADGFQLPTAAAPLVAGANLSILLDGKPVDPSAIEYAGVAPGYAGLYQINLQLPVSTGANPEIRLQLDGAISIKNVHLPVSP
jgi:uncharacterized protein (TIGR03437 family)